MECCNVARTSRVARGSWLVFFGLMLAGAMVVVRGESGKDIYFRKNPNLAKQYQMFMPTTLEAERYYEQRMWNFSRKHYVKMREVASAEHLKELKSAQQFQATYNQMIQLAEQRFKRLEEKIKQGDELYLYAKKDGEVAVSGYLVLRRGVAVYDEKRSEVKQEKEASKKSKAEEKTKTS